MRYQILIAFVLYPFIVNCVCIVAGLLLYFLLRFLRRRRHGKTSK